MKGDGGIATVLANRRRLTPSWQVFGPLTDINVCQLECRNGNYKNIKSLN